MQNELDRASCSDCLASAARRTSEKITDATRPRLRTTLAVLLGNERQYTTVSQSWSHDQRTLVVQCMRLLLLELVWCDLQEKLIALHSNLSSSDA